MYLRSVMRRSKLVRNAHLQVVDSAFSPVFALPNPRAKTCHTESSGRLESDQAQSSVVWRLDNSSYNCPDGHSPSHSVGWVGNDGKGIAARADVQTSSFMEDLQIAIRMTDHFFRKRRGQFEG